MLKYLWIPLLTFVTLNPWNLGYTDSEDAIAKPANQSTEDPLFTIQDANQGHSPVQGHESS